MGAEERDVEVAGGQGDGGDDVDPGREVGLGVQTRHLTSSPAHLNPLLPLNWRPREENLIMRRVREE